MTWQLSINLNTSAIMQILIQPHAVANSHTTSAAGTWFGTTGLLVHILLLIRSKFLFFQVRHRRWRMETISNTYFAHHNYMFRLPQRSRHWAVHRIRKTKQFCVQPEDGYVEVAEICSCDVQNMLCTRMTVSILEYS